MHSKKTSVFTVCHQKCTLYHVSTIHREQPQTLTNILAVTKILNEIELCPVKCCRPTKEYQEETH